MDTKYKVCFKDKGVKYTELGRYVRSMVKRLHTTIQRICKLSNFSITTYYKIVKGYEFPLNFYWRLKYAFLQEIAEDEEKSEFLHKFDMYMTQGVCLHYSFE